MHRKGFLIRSIALTALTINAPSARTGQTFALTPIHSRAAGVAAAAMIGLLAAMFLTQAIARSLPVIELYREGIACRLVGRAPGFNLSGKIGLMINLLSGRGFRQTMYRTEWPAFAGAVITGVPMMYVLTLRGAATDPQGDSVTSLHFAQHELGDSIHDVAAAINRAAQSSEIRNRLPSWNP